MLTFNWDPWKCPLTWTFNASFQKLKHIQTLKETVSPGIDCRLWTPVNIKGQCKYFCETDGCVLKALLKAFHLTNSGFNQWEASVCPGVNCAECFLCPQAEIYSDKPIKGAEIKEWRWEAAIEPGFCLLSVFLREQPASLTATARTYSHTAHRLFG